MGAQGDYQVSSFFHGLGRLGSHLSILQIRKWTLGRCLQGPKVGSNRVKTTNSVLCVWSPVAWSDLESHMRLILVGSWQESSRKVQTA